MRSRTGKKSAGRRKALVISSSADDDIDQHGDDIFSLGCDVALRILLHLPLKSLFMLKCVSKQWLAAISDPFLAKLKSTTAVDSISGLLKLYPLHFSNKQILFTPDHISDKATAINKAITSMKVDGEKVQILDSHKGLLLCCENGSRRGKVTHYFVCNILTNHYVRLPIPSEVRYRHKFAKLICEEDQHFKIIQISQSKKFEVLHTFYFERGRWKVSKMALPLHIGKFPMRPLTLLGKTLFWVANSRDSLCAYNIEEERFFELPMPGVTQANLCVCLCVSLGALYYVERTIMPKIVLTVWVLDNEDDQLSGITKDVAWVMTHKIDMLPIFQSHKCFPQTSLGAFSEFNPLAFHSIHPNILFLKLTNREFGVLDINKNELTRVCHPEAPDYRIHNHSFFLNGTLRNSVCPFEEPVWMLTLPSVPLFFSTKYF